MTDYSFKNKKSKHANFSPNYALQMVIRLDSPSRPSLGAESYKFFLNITLTSILKLLILPRLKIVTNELMLKMKLKTKMKLKIFLSFKQTNYRFPSRR